MIPRAFITEWREYAPWQTNEQIEQDLVISRALVELYSDDMVQQKLAFRGGTALHKLHLAPPVRYSEDIDLVQIEPGPIGEVFDRVRNVLSFLGEPRIKQKNRNNLITYTFSSEIPPAVPLKLKIEINCREHIAVFPLQKINYKVKSRWFAGESLLTTYTLEELLGSKIRALYQRKKGRDLFDLWYAITQAEPSPEKIIEAFNVFMKSSGVSITKNQLIKNMELKIQDAMFIGDVQGLLRVPVKDKFNIDEAWQMLLKYLFSYLK